MLLLEAIEKDGVIQSAGPEWMTSAPEADAWLVLPDQAALLLARDDQAVSGREYIAKNTRVPKRRKAKASAKPVDQPALERDLPISDEERELIQISQHARERLKTRYSLEWDTQAWLDRLRAGELLETPSWANAAGGDGWSVVWMEAGDQWAAILRPDLGSESGWIVPTILSLNWAERDLDEVRENRGMIEYSRRVEQWWQSLGEGTWEDELKESPLALTMTDLPGPWLQTRAGNLKLYPSDPAQRLRGVRWVLQNPPD
jgi:hypothetical protein